MNDSWGGGWKAPTLLIRECCMMKVINELSDKPEWWRKVKEDTIANRWKKEALVMDWAAYLNNVLLLTLCQCIQELRIKADLYENSGLMPVYDYRAAVIKSDAIMTPELAASLRDAIKPLEDIPPEAKDWHPRSHQRVLDLVHPSLWPLVYGRSRVLRDRVISLEDSLDYCGMGSVIPLPSEDETRFIICEGGFSEERITILSNKFQWLPCDVDLNPTTGRAKVVSYINNLHPQEHAHLYPIIETFIEKSLPAWDIVLRWETNFAVQRLKVDNVGINECFCPEVCNPDVEEFRSGSPAHSDEESEESESDPGSPSTNALDVDWYVATHKMKLPDPCPKANGYVRMGAEDVKKAGFFGGKKQIQVIVKLANIHLTPERPFYNGGSWHTEGQLNEHIVSTALYYYDNENITDSSLSFRTCANKDGINEGMIGYEQDDHLSLERTFAINARGNLLQDIGSVLTKEGRALFFPNTLQHCVSSFKLADPTRPGHRKILALFLVDPAIPIISTANVPPQQKHWWSAQAGFDSGKGILPTELVEKVIQDVDWPIDLEEAKDMRLELMKDRSWFKDQEEERLESQQWNFCEH
ncbi:hypothetical protein ACHAQA_010027 [Verticillium albo-atrum]